MGCTCPRPLAVPPSQGSGTFCWKFSGQLTIPICRLLASLSRLGCQSGSLTGYACARPLITLWGLSLLQEISDSLTKPTPADDLDNLWVRSGVEGLVLMNPTRADCLNVSGSRLLALSGARWRNIPSHENPSAGWDSSCWLSVIPTSS